jgi:hypothetical protein
MTAARALAAATLLAAACGGSSGQVTPSSLAEAEQSLERVFCQLQARCGQIGASEQPQCERDALAALAAFHVSHYSGLIDYAVLDAAVASGREVFDRQVAATCINMVATTACSGALDAVQSCLVAFTGTVAAGGACGAPGDCASGFCITSGSSCAGTCRSMIAPSGDCNGFVDACATGAYCSSNTRKCISLAASGATCEWQGSTLTCQDGLYCDALSRLCKPVGASGAKCAFDWECGSGLRCGAQQQCAAPVPEGGSCQQSIDCASGSWCVGAAPAANGLPPLAGMCRAAPGHTGDPCMPGSCTTGLFCDTIARPLVCRVLVAAGGACPVQGSCADGTTCVAGTCTAFLDEGGACDPTRNATACPDDMRCDSASRTCVAVGTLGAPCTGGCRRLLYCDPQSMKCAAQLAPGAACTPASPGGANPCVLGACDPTTNTCAAPSC